MPSKEEARSHEQVARDHLSAYPFVGVVVKPSDCAFFAFFGGEFGVVVGGSPFFPNRAEFHVEVFFFAVVGAACGRIAGFRRYHVSAAPKERLDSVRAHYLVENNETLEVRSAFVFVFGPVD